MYAEKKIRAQEAADLELAKSYQEGRDFDQIKDRKGLENKN